MLNHTPTLTGSPGSAKNPSTAETHRERVSERETNKKTGGDINRKYERKETKEIGDKKVIKRFNKSEGGAEKVSSNRGWRKEGEGEGRREGDGMCVG